MTKHMPLTICTLIAVSGITVGAVSFVTGAPMWMVLMLIVMLPAFCLLTYYLAFKVVLQRYFLLLYITVPTLVLGAFEAWQHRTIPGSVLKFLDLPSGPGEPDLFLEMDLPGVLFQLYPKRGETLFVRGFQVKLCYDDLKASQPLPPICQGLTRVELAEVRKYFELAFRTGTKTEENLYYHYVEILMRSQAPQAEVDVATQNWRQNFPYSRRPDPRQYFSTES